MELWLLLGSCVCVLAVWLTPLKLGGLPPEQGDS